MHRDEIERAEKILLEAEGLLLDLEEKMFTKEKELRYEGSYRDCVEEFVEAKMFYEFLKINFY